MSSMGRFRKKPVVIRAARVSDIRTIARNMPGGLPAWIRGALDNGTVKLAPRDSGVVIKTLEGEMYGEEGDWIICGVKGEFYACKPDIFEQTYEAVNE